MKTALRFIAAAGLAVALTVFVTAHRVNSRRAAQLAELQAVWLTEKAALETAVEEANARARNAPAPFIPAPSVSAPAAKLTPAEIIAQLVALKSAPTNNPRTMRRAIYWLEELIAAGPAALPAIREFLQRNEEIDFVGANQSRGNRTTTTDSALPVSLRFGLLDVVKQIGGAEAEAVLAEVLGTTGRGIEVAWLARALQEIAPNKYRDAALEAARDLLGSVTDREERDQLFGVPTMYDDKSYVSTAQAQLLRPSGKSTAAH